jgi:hypothetical protein
MLRQQAGDAVAAVYAELAKMRLRCVRMVETSNPKMRASTRLSEAVTYMVDGILPKKRDPGNRRRVVPRPISGATPP